MRCLTIALLILVVGCSSSRVVSITPHPPDAILSIDGIPRGTGPLTAKFKFHHSDDIHTVTASRSGYKQQTITLTRDDPSTDFQIYLKPMTHRVTFNISPVPAFVDINGTPVSSEPVRQFTKELEFTKDSHENWTHYTVTASRPGFQPGEIDVSGGDSTSDYSLQLQPMRKDVTITTTPPGAAITVDGDALGNSPVVDKDRAFNFDVDANQYVARKIVANKPGYDPGELSIAWDDGKTDYHIDLPVKKKTVHISTDPAGAVVTIDGKVLPPGDGGNATTDLAFPPVDDKGTLPGFTAIVTKKTSETEWTPVNIPIGWDDGKTDYSATLKEIKTRPLDLLQLSMERDSDGVWQIVPKVTQSLGLKDISEGAGRQPPSRLYAAPAGSSIGSLTVSPNGSLIVFTLLTGKDPADFRSQIVAIGTDSTGGVQQLTDGKALDVMPSFTPDGDSIVFSSNRAGKRLNIWRKSITGGAGIEQLTTGQEQDLWPTVDALPKPRLFYQAMSDSQSDPQLYVTPIDGGSRLDLADIGVWQPRVSPKADSVLFTSLNARTGHQELYRIPDHGGPPSNLSNDPDTDYYDPNWSKDGSQICYVCNRGLDEDRHPNADIWTIDLAHPDKPTQVTTNGSVDDCPVWDPSGTSIYFRSNRGGQWGIWKIGVR